MKIENLQHEVSFWVEVSKGCGGNHHGSLKGLVQMKTTKQFVEDMVEFANRLPEETRLCVEGKYLPGGQTIESLCNKWKKLVRVEACFTILLVVSLMVVAVVGVLGIKDYDYHTKDRCLTILGAGTFSTFFCLGVFVFANDARKKVLEPLDQVVDLFGEKGFFSMLARQKLDYTVAHRLVYLKLIKLAKKAMKSEVDLDTIRLLPARKVDLIEAAIVSYKAAHAEYEKYLKESIDLGLSFEVDKEEHFRIAGNELIEEGFIKGVIVKPA